MDLTSSWVLLLVILLGGIIALYADRLGRNLGKKRLKLGSLRPRRTAEIIVFAAGMLTPLLAILAIMGVSAEARIWILKGYAAAQEARRAVSQRDRALEQYERVLQQARDLDIQLKDMEAHQRELRAQSAQYESKARTAESRATSANARVSQVAGELRSRQRTLDQVQKSLASASVDLRDLSQNFDELSKQRDEANDEVLKLRGDIDALNTRLATGQGDLTKVRQELSGKQQELRDAEEARKKAVEELDRALDEMDRKLSEARQTLEQFQLDVQEVAARWLTEPLIFRRDEEITRVAVGKQLSRSEAERALEGVLTRARREAADRGAAPNDQGVEAGFLPFNQQDGTKLSPEAQRAEIIRQLTGRGQEGVIVAKVLVNRFAGQFVPLQVGVHDNPIVFREGELLGEVRIDGSAPVGRLFEEIGAMLRDQVRSKAQSSGMIPASGREDAFGSVDPGEIFSLITAIQNAGRTVRLQALAKNDTRAGGPLALDFRLR